MRRSLQNIKAKDMYDRVSKLKLISEHESIKHCRSTSMKEKKSLSQFVTADLRIEYKIILILDSTCLH